MINPNTFLFAGLGIFLFGYQLKKVEKVLIFLVITIFIMSSILPVQAGEIPFTDEEKNYIRESRALKVVSLYGIAPLSYIDSKGNIRGIGISVLDEISKLAGLNFEYELYASVSDALASDFDIFANSERKYAPDKMLLSQPYLESETILFYNKSLGSKHLEDKIYASIAGGTLPEGIKEERTIYFNDREETIEAVENGRADYGFGNAYSLAFYTLQNSYKNIITIPTGKEERFYCLGVWQGNEILLSVINKSIEAIGKGRIDTLVLDVASQVERKITASMIMESYWKEILSFLIVVLLMLVYIVFLTMSSKRRIAREHERMAIENERYEIVAQISDNYLIEYLVKEEKLYLPEKISEHIDISIAEEKITGLIKEKELVKSFDEGTLEKDNHVIKLFLLSGETGIFRVVFSCIKDVNGNVYSIVGKLVNITKEEKEKEQLITKAQLDGLTGLYNMTAAKEAIIKSMKKKASKQIDALIIIDCDKFKDINDKYGHLKGNTVLINIAKGLRATFRQSDVMGRLGGDEFWVYMHDIPSVEFVQNKGQQLTYNIHELSDKFQISISIGIGIFKEEISYEELFQRADEALYVAKGKGGSQIIVYEEKNK